MNRPIRKNGVVLKEATAASRTIHALLTHVRQKGVRWVPESFGLTADGKHALEYLDGFVAHDLPAWLWNPAILTEVAVALRQWHAATVDFKIERPLWLFASDEPAEVICHNDFAPYNCVFRDEHFAGLIDFDLCSPGSRLWDLAYAGYRFIPLMPDDRSRPFIEYSPFTREVMFARLEGFLAAYSQGAPGYHYDRQALIAKLQHRLIKLGEWSEVYGRQNRDAELQDHAQMYFRHSAWLAELLL
jgi:hypothetical protein